MTEKHTLTVVINVFDDKYCDVYFFTPEHKKWCANLMCNNKFASFVKDSIYYPLFNTKYDNPEKDLKSLVRTYLNAQFNRIRDMNINSYLDFSQSYSLEPAFDIDDCVMDEVYVCDYCIGKLYNPDLFHNRTPCLYRANEYVCDDDCAFHLVQDDLDDVISTVRRCGDALETFAELPLYAVKDDRGIEVCPFSVGNKDYFVRKAREHADVEYYLTHKTYIYEYKNGKTNKIYGCCRFNEDSNVVALNLEKEDNQDSNSNMYGIHSIDKDVIKNIEKKTDILSENNFNFTVHENLEFEQTNSVISDLIQQNREQSYYKYIVQIIPDYNSFAIKDVWRDYKECLCYEGAEKCVKEIVDDPRNHKAKRVRIVVESIDSSLERYIKDHTDSNGNLKPKSVTLSPEHIGKTITCAGCKDNIPYGKPFAYYDHSAYCSKKCCVDHIWEGDNNRLFEVSPDKSFEEYDREFLRYYSYE